MPEDGKKAAVVGGLGLVGLGIWALTRKAEAAPPEPPPGRANLYGKVTDAVTGNKIPGVLVTLDGYSTYTDNAGNYLFPDLEPGSYVAQFTKEGYQTEVF